MKRSLKSLAWKHWLKQIDRLLENPCYKWAKDTLKGIKESVQENKAISERQIQAVKNIRNELYND